MDGVIDPNGDYVGKLSQSLGRRWSAIQRAKQSASEVRQLVAHSVTEKLGTFSSGDVDIVVFGSLARGEWTNGSDVDWTLLIDGQVAPEHRTLAREIRDTIPKTNFRGKSLLQPGAEGIFGSMAFSHDIVHYIGGQADTNRNTTQRILLLLEAYPIRHRGYKGDLGPYDRVVRHILYRYLHDDTNFFAATSDESRIPRFLLNDIVRYWRTMCVDFAYKEWEQAGKKWALRSIKLRMARKLLFASALLTVFSCFRNPSLRVSGPLDEQYIPRVQKHLEQYVATPSLEIVAWTLSQLGLSQHCGRLFDHYDEFLKRLDDERIRGRLDELDPKKVYEDADFLELRDNSHEFQRALTEVFFECGTELRDFIIEYGVF